MALGDMKQVVLIQVWLHLDAIEVQPLVVGRARQRREDEELDDVNGQFALDDPDAASTFQGFPIST
jgi:hypothetical protein